MDTTKPQPDLQALALTKAIRQQETGGNYNAVGDNATSTGAYQFQSATWKAFSKQILGDANAQMTPENQNAVAYGMVKTWKDQGLGPAEIAAKWNSGSEKGWENKVGTTTRNGQSLSYNVPVYVQGVVNNFKQIYPQVAQQFGQTAQTEQPQTQTPQNNSALFPAKAGDNALEIGAKTIGNLIPSAFNFVKGAIMTPIEGLAHLGDIPGAVADFVNQDAGGSNKLGNLAGGLYDTVVPQAARQVVRGDFGGASQTITNDPVGQIAPFLLAGEGIAKGLDTATGGMQSGMNVAKSMVTKDLTPMRPAFEGAYGDAISSTAKLAEPVVNAAGAVVGKATGLLGAVTKSAASHLTGLDSQTITQILQNPEAFSKLEQDQVNRGGLASEFGKSIDTLESKLQETGTGYEPVRQLQGQVAIPENFFEDALAKFGLKLVKEEGTNPTTPSSYQVVADTNSATRNTSDIHAVQKFINDWGDKTTLTSNEYLNMRSDLADLANYDKLTGMGKTKTSQVIADSIRQEANRTIRPQIPGLKELDNQYAPLRQQFEQIKRDFLQKDSEGGYTFKDGAINKIANATGVGKDNLLARMEELVPGITQRIKILKAAEDIERAKSIKVGAYGRGALEAFGVATLNVPAVVAAIVTNPSVAVPLIRGLGWSGAKVGAVVGTLKMIGGDINHLKLPEAFKDAPSPYVVAGTAATVKK